MFLSAEEMWIGMGSLGGRPTLPWLDGKVAWKESCHGVATATMADGRTIAARDATVAMDTDMATARKHRTDNRPRATMAAASAITTAIPATFGRKSFLSVL